MKDALSDLVPEGTFAVMIDQMEGIDRSDRDSHRSPALPRWFSLPPQERSRGCETGLGRQEGPVRRVEEQACTQREKDMKEERPYHVLRL